MNYLETIKQQINNTNFKTTYKIGIDIQGLSPKITIQFEFNSNLLDTKDKLTELEIDECLALVMRKLLQEIK